MRNAQRPGRCLLLASICAASLALPARAADQEAATAAFNAAINQGDGASLLSIWPEGTVTLFGKKVSRAEAGKVLAQKNGVYALLRWHGPNDETREGPVPPGDPEMKGGKVIIAGSGYGKQTACTLASSSGNWTLRSCKKVDNGSP